MASFATNGSARERESDSATVVFPAAGMPVTTTISGGRTVA